MHMETCAHNKCVAYICAWIVGALVWCALLSSALSGPGSAYNGNTQEENYVFGSQSTAKTSDRATVLKTPGLAAWQLRLDRVYDDVVAVQVRAPQAVGATHATAVQSGRLFPSIPCVEGGGGA